MNYKKAGRISTAMGIVAISITLLMDFFTDGELNLFSGFVIVFLIALLCGAATIKAVFHKCPHCGGALPFRSSVGNFCKHWGKRLE